LRAKGAAEPPSLASQRLLGFFTGHSGECLPMFRRSAAAAMLILGLWLSYDALYAVILIVGRGSSIADALLAPPSGLIRIMGAGLMSMGGLLALFSQRGAGILATIGATLILGLGGLIAVAGADPSLWMTTAFYGVAALVLSGLLLSLRS